MRQKLHSVIKLVPSIFFLNFLESFSKFKIRKFTKLQIKGKAFQFFSFIRAIQLILKIRFGHFTYT